MHFLWFRVIIPDTPPPTVKLIEKVEELQQEIAILKRGDSTIIVNQQEEVSLKPIDKKESKAYQTRMRLRSWHIFTDIFTFILITGIAVAFKSTISWFQNEEKRQEAERQKYEVELKNLKSQINPHFLFNTLNNIYALIAISQDKAQ